MNEAGLEPRGEMTDPLPYEHHAFFSGAAKGTVKWAVRAGLHKVGLAQRLFTVHYAVLTTRA